MIRNGTIMCSFIILLLLLCKNNCGSNYGNNCENNCNTRYRENVDYDCDKCDECCDKREECACKEESLIVEREDIWTSYKNTVAGKNCR